METPVTYDCTGVREETQVMIPAAEPASRPTLSVSADVCGMSERTGALAGYIVIARTVRTFKRWITVTAKAVYRRVTRLIGLTRLTRRTRLTKMYRVLSFAGGLRL